MKASEPKWADLARTSIEEFIHEVRAKLPEQASIAEIEAVLLSEYQQVLRDIFQGIILGKTAPRKGLPAWTRSPRHPPLSLSGTPWTRKTQRTKTVRHLWGKLQVKVQCLEHREKRPSPRGAVVGPRHGKHVSLFLDSSLDSSGWTPASLAFLAELVTQLPAECAAELAQKAGVNISRAELDRLARDLGEACSVEQRSTLLKLAHAPLEPAQPESDGRVMVLQMDGCFVLGQARDGKCPGVEIKTAGVYPQNAPRERTLYSSVEAAEDFCDPVAGLLRQAGVRQNDTVVLVGDGAPWIARIAELQNLPLVLDVFHASHYLDEVMQASDWTEAQRSTERKRLLKGELNVQRWLETYLPLPCKRQTWSEEATGALNYLQARLTHMDYPAFLARGWPMGSGQIEGINKSVIGHRMKRSGQHWSRPGARGMASLRARRYSRRSPLSQDQLRHAAFPTSQI